MPPILRGSLLVTISISLSIIDQHPHLTDGSVHDAKYAEYKREVHREMLPYLEVSGLDKLETDEERREIHVDFSTLPVAIPVEEKLQAKVLLNMYDHGLQFQNLREKAEKLHQSDHEKYSYDLEKFCTGMVALGVGNFMMATTQFCEEEAAGGAIDIVSVGSGDGTNERFIMAEYRSRYGKGLPRIKLVDPDPAFAGTVDYKTVDHLIEERPNIVKNCVAFIIWPLVEGPEQHDIEAVRKLQPRAVFVVYEYTGASCSVDFRASLRDKKLEESISPEEFGVHNWLAKNQYYEKENYGLDNYKIIEIAHQKLWLPEAGTFIYRMVKLKRDDEPEHDSSDF